MKIVIIKSKKSIFLFKNNNIYTFLIKNKKINKIEFKNFLQKKYNIKIIKLNIIKVKKKKKSRKKKKIKLNIYKKIMFKVKKKINKFLN